MASKKKSTGAKSKPKAPRKKRKGQFKMSPTDAKKVRGLLAEVRSIGAKYSPKKRGQLGLGL